jgi:hypothetical protein
MFNFYRIRTFITILTKPPPPDPVLNQANSVYIFTLQTPTVSFPSVPKYTTQPLPFKFFH